MEKLHKRKKTSVGDTIFVICNTLFMILFVLITLYPILNTVAISLNDGTDALRGGIYLWPRKFTWKNYLTVLQKDNLLTGAYISVARTVVGTLLALIANAILAFIVSRKRFLFKKQLSLFWVITMYVNGGMIPTFLLYKNLGMTNSFWVYVIPVIVQPFNIILVKTYMESIPRSLQEAAEIDGAGIMKVFLKIILPTSTPILATIAIFAAVAQWNSFQDTLIYVTDQKLYSLQYILYQYINQANSLATMVKNSSGGTNLNMAALATQQTPTSIRMTVSVIVVMPILFIYPMFQRYFVKGIMIGSVKG